MKIYHATTPKKAKRYRNTGYIRKPVRGFNTLQGAMCWSLSIEGKRQVFLEINCPEDKVYKLPDHHNRFGDAYWCDENVDCNDYRCILDVSN